MDLFFLALRGAFAFIGFIYLTKYFKRSLRFIIKILKLPIKFAQKTRRKKDLKQSPGTDHLNYCREDLVNPSMNPLECEMKTFFMGFFYLIVGIGIALGFVLI